MMSRGVKDAARKPCGCPNTGAPKPKSKLIFHCQLAHGSPTGVITGFTNVKELYTTIAECYDIDPSEVLFITLNTHKPDMNRLLGGYIGLEDFIFAHVKGQKKEVTFKKDKEALGVTITDNGAGYAFIKKVKEDSTVGNVPGILTGDHIERINDVTVSGMRHFEVARILKEIPVGSILTLRLIEPLKTGFSEIGGRYGYKTPRNGAKTGRETLRLRQTGPAIVEIPDDVVDVAVAKINSLLETFMGISDTELAQSIWEVGADKDNPHDFALGMDNSDMEPFAFTDDFIFDIWGAITDAKQENILRKLEIEEKF